MADQGQKPDAGGGHYLHAGRSSAPSGSSTQLAICITNPTPSSALKNKTPYEAFYGTKPHLSMLRVFGYRACVHVQRNSERRANGILGNAADDSPLPSGGDKNAVSDAEGEDGSFSEAASVFQPLETVYKDEKRLIYAQALEQCHNQVIERSCQVAAANTKFNLFRKAMERPDKEEWFEAALVEIWCPHVKNETWELVKLLLNAAIQ